MMIMMIKIVMINMIFNGKDDINDNDDYYCYDDKHTYVNDD